MTSTIALDHRVSKLEHFVYNELAVKVESMNWAIGQTYQSTEAMRIDIAGLHVGLADLETIQAANTAALKAAINLRSSELQHRLGETEASLRHDMGTFRESVRQGFQAVNERFEQVDRRFEQVDRRFDAVDQRFDAMDRRVTQFVEHVDGRLDQILAAVQGGKGTQ